MKVLMKCENCGDACRVTAGWLVQLTTLDNMFDIEKQAFMPYRMAKLSYLFLLYNFLS